MLNELQETFILLALAVICDSCKTLNGWAERHTRNSDWIIIISQHRFQREWGSKDNDLNTSIRFWSVKILLKDSSNWFLPQFSPPCCFSLVCLFVGAWYWFPLSFSNNSACNESLRPRDCVMSVWWCLILHIVCMGEKAKKLSSEKSKRRDNFEKVKESNLVAA